MDIEYLLLLQNFREATGNVLSPALEWLSDFMVDTWPFALMFFIYWALDRKSGRLIIAGHVLGLFANGFLKLVFCVYRPWIRDARVVPYGNAMTGATGYSFPSGHSTWATAIFGGIGVWQRKRNRAIAALFFVLAAIVLFSRNYLGVHTPQDVLVGCLSTVLMMWIVYKIEAWTDADPSRDLPVLIAGIVIGVAATAFYFLKPYPLDYLADGSLLVDPAKMRMDSLQGTGYFVAYAIARYFERRGFAFDEETSRRSRILFGLVAASPLFAWFTLAKQLIVATLGSYVWCFASLAVPIFYGLLLIPTLMRLLPRTLADADLA